MTAQPHARVRFRRAIERRALWLAEDAARELPNLSRESALQLVHLYAERGSPKYERAARRGARFTREDQHAHRGSDTREEGARDPELIPRSREGGATRQVLRSCTLMAENERRDDRNAADELLGENWRDPSYR